ncbi:ACT domain-containing protein [Tenacibaculum sp. 1B UA]|uniref:ACT domain-containing protein n=1 Tax=unclassified Tenacibaculum TaxID=2635139 RepID=UPI0026E3548E|nr:MULTISPECIES: ACT domain-containing protein [unclassified Tenacibaculum]MDO6674077.1 ACT domain-containing protein [Tenacibaculum sp. 1_MG-2023]MDX8552401.1 ACT domain-containing protein [Tenacibaculum sp. 1B UA]
MTGEKNLSVLIREMKPFVNKGEYVFTTVKDIHNINKEDIVGQFKEAEGITLILEKKVADNLELAYSFIASWITLKIHSALDAVGLTAAFSSELAKHDISCNVVAGFYHDHIFVDKKDETKTINVLTNLSKSI